MRRTGWSSKRSRGWPPADATPPPTRRHRDRPPVDLLDRLSLDVPVCQAGMGGGLAGAELAGAVASAGGLGTLGILPADSLRRGIDAARERAGGRPVAVNLLLPFARRAHFEAAGAADA